MIAPLNDIYRQVGVSFYLDSVTVTNIPGAYSLLYDSTTNDVWNFDRLVDIGHGTGGIECYFVNDLVCADGSPGPVGANSSGGIVLTARASAHTLAHEIGHAFGLKDIYAANTGIGERVPPGEEKSVGLQRMCFACSTSDWNGGCGGSGEGGCRYYPSDTRLYAVLYRLLMYGQEMSDEPRSCDITHGNVRGVWYDTIGNSKIWDDDDAPVGFFVNLRRKNSPAHE